MYDKYIISLCDYTGIMVKPWVEAGYRALLVDPQHKLSSNFHDDGVERFPGTVLEALSIIPNQTSGSQSFLCVRVPSMHGRGCVWC